MLEKISARNDFIIFSFSELIPELFCHKEKSIDQLFQEYDKMATITQAVDVIPYGNDKLICKNVLRIWKFTPGDCAFLPMCAYKIPPFETKCKRFLEILKKIFSNL